MLFNSYGFVFLFLPLALAGFYLLGRNSRSGALLWLTLASLFFYAWWRPVNVLLIAPSILVNFGLARLMQRLLAKQDRRATLVLIVGILFNVLFLGYFKYKNFFFDTMNQAFGTDLPLVELLLPLGISFITFQKIAFLVDVHGGKVESFTFRDYCLFVLFFPQLIAGPIVHYREVMPQFRQATCRYDASEATLGLTLFAMGLFKKVILADGISPQVSALFLHATTGGELSFVAAWLAAIGYTLQIYFDFSAYSDMALGLARFFGIRLPVNFDSPLRATNIIDFWLRWHMTLTRFLTAYIYNPMAMALTRSRMKAGKPLYGGAKSTLGAFVVLLAFPTLVVMLISGVWHGAGFKFAIWGLLHGVYLCVNHAWRGVPAVRKWRSGKTYQKVMAPVGWALTFGSVVLAMAFFGASSTSAAVSIVKGMVGLNGFDLPAALYWTVSPLNALKSVGFGENAWWGMQEFLTLLGWTAALLAIALASPNTLKILNWSPPAATRTATAAPSARFAGLVPVQWSASLGWAVVVAVLAGYAVSHMGGPSEFLYWQF